MDGLLNLDILELCFNSGNHLGDKRIFDIIYNRSNIFWFTNNYINLLELAISDKVALQSLIVELVDSSRIQMESTQPKDNLREEFVEISNNGKLSSLIPIVIEDTSNLLKDISFLTIVNRALPLNKHWLTLELLTNCHIQVSHLNFTNNIDIDDFFKSLFLIPKYIKELIVFDREQTALFLTSVKGRHIKYYTQLGKGWSKKLDRISAKEELISFLGGKLKLFYTNDPRKIHERKIIFEDILVTIDNSRNNLSFDDPTWEIFVTCDKEKASKWQDKCHLFEQVV